MRRRRTPWLSGAALFGAGAGGLLAAAVWFLPASWPADPRRVASPAILILSYAFGVLVMYRRRENADTRAFLELREELRFSQDHIMANETHRSLSAYLEIAAHQMKEPLRALVSGIDALVAEQRGLPETVARQVSALKTHMDSLGATLRHLSGYALTRPGRAPFSVNVLLRESILLCRGRAAEKKIVFEERYGVVPPVMGSAMRVHQALFNIIVNAVEAMPFGGGTIEVTTSHENDRVIARVRDSGIGIRPDHLPRVFEPFFTSKPEKNGVGLGLWAARQMLDIIGADIVIESAPLKGTEVRITFPQAAPLRPGREGTAHPPELERNTADDQNRQIA
jgi:two-component system NtrC family sensor kinase